VVRRIPAFARTRRKSCGCIASTAHRASDLANSAGAESAALVRKHADLGLAKAAKLTVREAARCAISPLVTKLAGVSSGPTPTASRSRIGNGLADPAVVEADVPDDRVAQRLAPGVVVGPLVDGPAAGLGEEEPLAGPLGAGGASARPARPDRDQFVVGVIGGLLAWRPWLWWAASPVVPMREPIWFASWHSRDSRSNSAVAGNQP